MAANALIVLTVLLLTLYTTLSTRGQDQENETFGLHNLQLPAMLKRVVYSLGLAENTDKNPRRKNKAGGAKSSPEKERFVRLVHAGGKVEQYPHIIPVARLMDKYPGMCIALPEVFKSPHNSVLWPDEFLLPGQKYIIINSRAVEKLKRKYPEDRTREPNGVRDETLEAEITKSHGQHEDKENGNLKVHSGMSQEILEAKPTVSPDGSKISPGRCENSPGGSKRSPGGSKLSPVRCTNSPGGSKNTRGGRRFEDEAKMRKANGGQEADAMDHFCCAKDFYAAKEKWSKYPKRKGMKGKPFVPPLPKAQPFSFVGWHPSLSPVQELSP